MSIVSKILELLEHRGAASGYASLDASSLVAQKPADRLSKANLEFTLNKLLKGAGAGADPTEVDAPVSLTCVASDTLVNLNDTERNGTYKTAYFKIKEIKVNEWAASSVRITWEMKCTQAGVWGKIYHNGVAVGVEKNTTSTSYVLFSDDIDSSTWVAGDLVQLYYRVHPSESGSAFKNLRLYYSVGFSTTNQDP